jgi:hypothetical protein
MDISWAGHWEHKMNGMLYTLEMLQFIYYSEYGILILGNCQEAQF